MNQIQKGILTRLIANGTADRTKVEDDSKMLLRSAYIRMPVNAGMGEYIAIHD